MLLIAILLSGCSTAERFSPTLDEIALPEPTVAELAAPSSTARPALPSPNSSPTNQPADITTSAPRPTSAPLATATPGPDAWKELPLLTADAERVREIYLHGLALGNDPHAFSKVGDCGSSVSWFLGPFDTSPQFYSLGEHTYLEPLIEYFQGSYGRQSVAARSGFNASSVFSPLWSDPQRCQPGEAPLVCEYRLHDPSFAFIMLGTNDRWHIDRFEPKMRQLIELTIAEGIVPIIGTKADNFEGDESINRIIARLALEYGVPLWNYWAAVQPLPNHGMDEDGVHLTWGPIRFDDPKVMQRAWPVRNLTAMQALQGVLAIATGS